MKPIKLSFQGINCFSSYTEIDFEKLGRAGLFGIFGNTGSGKSTILDCIMLALFGRTARKQNLSDYINRRGDRALVDFVFDVYEGMDRSRYSIRRIFKLNKHGDVITTASLSKLCNGEVYPQEDVAVNDAIKNIIGLGYNEFSKCIILPQNEFSSFLKEQRAERLKIVSKLFSLEKYDVLLSKKIKEIRAQLDGEYKQIQGGLEAVEEYSEDRLNLLKAARISQKQAISDTERKIDEVAKQLQQFEELRKLIQNLDEEKQNRIQFSQELKSLEELKTTIDIQPIVRKIKSDKGRFDEAERLLASSKKKVVLFISERDKLESKLSTITSESINDLKSEIDKLTNIAGVVSGYLGTVNEINTIEQKYTSLKKELDGKAEDLERCKNSASILFEKISAIGNPNEDLEKLFERLYASNLKTVFEDELKFLRTILNMLQTGNINSSYDIISAIEKRIDFVCEKLSSMGGESMIDGIPAMLKDAQDRLKIKQQLEGDYFDIKSKISVLDSEQKNILQQLQMLKEEGSEKRAVLSNASNEIGYEITTKQKFDASNEHILSNKKHAENKLAAFIAQKEQDELKLASIKMDIAVEENNVSFYQKDAEHLGSEIAQGLLSLNVKTVDEALKNYLDDVTEKEYNDKINTASEMLSNSILNIAKLEKLIDGRTYDNNVHNLALRNHGDMTEFLNSTRAELGKLEQQIDTVEEKLIQVKQLIEKKEAVVKKLDLYDKVYSVIGGCKLLDFIAEEYLSEISQNASFTLLKLTSGRYDLAYDDKFYVIDNLNCGEKRSITTLSGGETFLVSLSLALSMSEAIFERTCRPMEFFFLDEGFGSLDSDLIDVVVDSLEKLRNEHFTIGLISHVAELKQRISSKVLVTGATHNDSAKVEVV